MLDAADPDDRAAVARALQADAPDVPDPTADVTLGTGGSTGAVLDSYTWAVAIHPGSTVATDAETGATPSDGSGRGQQTALDAAAVDGPPPDDPD